MKIGITCYPTYGGSGVVATELGMELAARGHEVHFISYAPPIRLTDTNDRIHFHFVELDSVVGVGQANWRRVADEMDLMAARSQLHSQLGRDDARTAIRRVASDPNLHIVPSVPLVLLLVSARWEALYFL